MTEHLKPEVLEDYRPTQAEELEAAAGWGAVPAGVDPVTFAEGLVQLKKHIVFASGAQRSEVKPAYDQIVPEFIEGLAKRLAAGQIKYSRDNWKRGVGDKEWIRQVYSHLMQHLLDEWAMKPDDTDGNYDGYGNLDAIAWNVMVLNWFKRYDTETYRSARQSDV